MVVAGELDEALELEAELPLELVVGAEASAGLDVSPDDLVASLLLVEEGFAEE